jgi:hypothetical protein
MKSARWIAILFTLFFVSLFLFSCASAAPSSPAAEEPAQAEEAAAAEEAAPAEEVQETTVAISTEVPTQAANETNTVNTPTMAATNEVIATAETLPTITAVPVIPVIEQRWVELEWPSTMKYGESDVIRISLVPDEEGYQVTTEFEDHSTQTQTITVERTPGYRLYGIARLDGAGFDISPNAEQKYILPEGEVVHWRWSIAPRSTGQQRISISLIFRWEPEAETQGFIRETLAFSKALNIQVMSFLGMKQSSAISISFVGLFAGSILTLSGLVVQSGGRKRKSIIEEVKQNPDLSIETRGAIRLSDVDRSLLMALFNRHQRIIIENEFLSGYSGARTFLVRPILPDGKQEAQTIVKIGSRVIVLREYENYEQFVKDRLPPITARIQRQPVSIGKCTQAALQYTFLAEPGQSPLSLRRAFLDNPQVSYLDQLFENFSSHWWLQRSPYTFKLMQEYDAILPPHLILEPVGSNEHPGMVLDEQVGTGSLQCRPGDILKVKTFANWEMRADGESISLQGQDVYGQAPLRIRWMSKTPPNGSVARVVHTRESYLQWLVGDCSVSDFPDPILSINAILQKTIQGSKSIIHGDLNLENILVGPGSLVWLIDFAQTGEGHTLKDFAHLYMEVIAHIISVQDLSPQDFLEMLQNQSHPLLAKIEAMAQRCQLDMEQKSEFHLAAGLTCLGAIKFTTITEKARKYLYIAAAYLLSQ